MPEPPVSNKLLDWAVELQSLAQSALFYCTDKYDIERFTRIRALAAEMVAVQGDLPLEKVKDLFCGETGYQTPKLDTRAAVFRDGRILLVQEADGLWALPGGWVDAGLSVSENTLKEVREEAGLEVKTEKLIAVQDREKHNNPPHVFKICKIFVQCALVGGSFRANTETISSGWFLPGNLPPLSEDKTTAAQIALCFEAFRSENWQPPFD